MSRITLGIYLISILALCFLVVQSGGWLALFGSLGGAVVGSVCMWLLGFDE